MGPLDQGFSMPRPFWRVQYQRLLWLSWQAHTPGTTQTLVQAVLECRDSLPYTEPVGKAVQATR